MEDDQIEDDSGDFGNPSVYRIADLLQVTHRNLRNHYRAQNRSLTPIQQRQLEQLQSAHVRVLEEERLENGDDSDEGLGELGDDQDDELVAAQISFSEPQDDQEGEDGNNEDGDVVDEDQLPLLLDSPGNNEYVDVCQMHFRRYYNSQGQVTDPIAVRYSANVVVDGYRRSSDGTEDSAIPRSSQPQQQTTSSQAASSSRVTYTDALNMILQVDSSNPPAGGRTSGSQTQSQQHQRTSNTAGLGTNLQSERMSSSMHPTDSDSGLSFMAIDYEERYRHLYETTEALASVRQLPPTQESIRNSQFVNHVIQSYYRHSQYLVDQYPRFLYTDFTVPVSVQPPHLLHDRPGSTSSYTLTENIAEQASSSRPNSRSSATPGERGSSSRSTTRPPAPRRSFARSRRSSSTDNGHVGLTIDVWRGGTGLRTPLSPVIEQQSRVEVSLSPDESSRARRAQVQWGRETSGRAQQTPQAFRFSWDGQGSISALEQSYNDFSGFSQQDYQGDLEYFLSTLSDQLSAQGSVPDLDAQDEQQTQEQPSTGIGRKVASETLQRNSSINSNQSARRQSTQAKTNSADSSNARNLSKVSFNSGESAQEVVTWQNLVDWSYITFYNALRCRSALETVLDRWSVELYIHRMALRVFELQIFSKLDQSPIEQLIPDLNNPPMPPYNQYNVSSQLTLALTYFFTHRRDRVDDAGMSDSDRVARRNQSTWQNALIHAKEQMQVGSLSPVQTVYLPESFPTGNLFVGLLVNPDQMRSTDTNTDLGEAPNNSRQSQGQTSVYTTSDDESLHRAEMDFLDYYRNEFIKQQTSLFQKGKGLNNEVDMQGHAAYTRLGWMHSKSNLEAAAEISKVLTRAPLHVNARNKLIGTQMMYESAEFGLLPGQCTCIGAPSPAMYRLALLQKWKREETIHTLALLNQHHTIGYWADDLLKIACPACTHETRSQNKENSTGTKCPCCQREGRRPLPTKKRTSLSRLAAIGFLQRKWKWQVERAANTIGASRAWYNMCAEVTMLQVAAVLGFNKFSVCQPLQILAQRCDMKVYVETSGGNSIRRLVKTKGGFQDIPLGPVWRGNPLDVNENLSFNLPAILHSCLACSKWLQKSHLESDEQQTIVACSQLVQNLVGTFLGNIFAEQIQEPQDIMNRTMRLKVASSSPQKAKKGQSPRWSSPLSCSDMEDQKPRWQLLLEGQSVDAVVAACEDKGDYSSWWDLVTYDKKQLEREGLDISAQQAYAESAINVGSVTFERRVVSEQHLAQLSDTSSNGREPTPGVVLQNSMGEILTNLRNSTPGQAELEVPDWQDLSDLSSPTPDLSMHSIDYPRAADSVDICASTPQIPTQRRRSIMDFSRASSTQQDKVPVVAQSLEQADSKQDNGQSVDKVIDKVIDLLTISSMFEQYDGKKLKEVVKVVTSEVILLLQSQHSKEARNTTHEGDLQPLQALKVEVGDEELRFILEKVKQIVKEGSGQLTEPQEESHTLEVQVDSPNTHDHDARTQKFFSFNHATDSLPQQGVLQKASQQDFALGLESLNRSTSSDSATLFRVQSPVQFVNRKSLSFARANLSARYSQSLSDDLSDSETRGSVFGRVINSSYSENNVPYIEIYGDAEVLKTHLDEHSNGITIGEGVEYDVILAENSEEDGRKESKQSNSRPDVDFPSTLPCMQVVRVPMSSDIKSDEVQPAASSVLNRASSSSQAVSVVEELQPVTKKIRLRSAYVLNSMAQGQGQMQQVLGLGAAGSRLQRRNSRYGDGGVQKSFRIVKLVPARESEVGQLFLSDKQKRRIG